MTKTQAKNLLIEEPCISKEDWLQQTNMSERTYYNYLNGSSTSDNQTSTRKSVAIPKHELQNQVAEMQSKVEMFDKLEIDFSELQETYNAAFDKYVRQDRTNFELTNKVKEINRYNDELIAENLQLKEMQNERDEILQKYNALAINIQDDMKVKNANNLQLAKLETDLQNAKMQNENLQKDVQFYQSEAENELNRTGSIGYKATWCLIIVIVIANLINVWGGFAGVESNWFLQICNCIIFAGGGFAIANLKNANSNTKNAIMFFCISWEAIFASSNVFANIYKVQKLEDGSEKITYSNIVDMFSSILSTDPKQTAIWFSILFCATVCGILYTSINLIKSK